MPFKLNYRYRLYIFYKKNVDPCFKSKAANRLTKKLRNLMAIYKKNLQHAPKLQKQAYNKELREKTMVVVKKFG